MPLKAGELSVRNGKQGMIAILQNKSTHQQQ